MRVVLSNSVEHQAGMFFVDLQTVAAEVKDQADAAALQAISLVQALDKAAHTADGCVGHQAVTMRTRQVKAEQRTELLDLDLPIKPIYWPVLRIEKPAQHLLAVGDLALDVVLQADIGAEAAQIGLEFDFHDLES